MTMHETTKVSPRPTSEKKSPPTAGISAPRGKSEGRSRPGAACPSPRLPLLLRAEEAAGLLGVSRSHWYGLVSRGDLAAWIALRLTPDEKDSIRAAAQAVNQTLTGLHRYYTGGRKGVRE